MSSTLRHAPGMGLIAAAVVLAAPAAGLAAPSVGAPAPALVVRQLDGRTFDLAALRGQVVVVNIWASWCPPCRAEMPTLEAAFKDHERDGLVVIGLSEDRRGDRKAALRVSAAFSYDMAFLDDATANRFGVFRILPVTYVIDRRGVVRALLGAGGQTLTARSLEDVIAPLLAERP